MKLLSSHRVQECIIACYYTDPTAFSSLTRAFETILPHNRDIVFLCIGIDRSTGDAFGPLTGTFLTQYRIPNVWGNLQSPVHAGNLTEALNQIGESPFIVAIDASLGPANRLGYICLREGPLKPGSAVDKQLPPVGNLAVTMNVSLGGLANYLLLQTASLNTVWQGARLVARAIFLALYRRTKDGTL